MKGWTILLIEMFMCHVSGRNIIANISFVFEKEDY